MTIKLLISAVLLMSASVFAQRYISVEPGFVDGDAFRGLNSSQKATYVMGLVDGYYAAQLLGDGQGRTDWLELCLTQVRPDQIVAIFDNYLGDNPRYWGVGMNGAGLVALKDACSR